MLSDFQRAQISASYNLKQIYAEAMAERLARKLDTDLLALGSGLSAKVGDSATDVRVSTIEAALAKADSYCLPHEDLILFLHPTTYIKMRLLWETIISKLSKLRENLKEAIRSEAQKWERSTTIMRAPQMVIG